MIKASRSTPNSVKLHNSPRKTIVTQETQHHDKQDKNDTQGNKRTRLNTKVMNQESKTCNITDAVRRWSTTTKTSIKTRPDTLQDIAFGKSNVNPAPAPEVDNPKLREPDRREHTYPVLVAKNIIQNQHHTRRQRYKLIHTTGPACNHTIDLDDLHFAG